MRSLTGVEISSRVKRSPRIVILSKSGSLVIAIALTRLKKSVTPDGAPA
jgi:hypothetical protein